MNVKAEDILKLEAECKQLETSIATSRGKISQLKQGLEHHSVEDLKEELVKLEEERVRLETEYNAKRAEYDRNYYASQKS